MLAALAGAGIGPDLVLGTSIGGINGAFVAAHPVSGVTQLGELWRQDRTGTLLGDGLVSQLRTLRRTPISLHSNDQLEISRIDAGVVELTWDDVRLGEFVPEAMANLDDAPLELDPAAADLIVRADKRRLAQVLVNLIDNARCHGGGVVRVGVEAAAGCVRLVWTTPALAFQPTSVSASSNASGVAGSRPAEPARAPAWACRWWPNTSSSMQGASGWRTGRTGGPASWSSSRWCHREGSAPSRRLGRRTPPGSLRCAGR